MAYMAHGTCCFLHDAPILRQESGVIVLLLDATNPCRNSLFDGAGHFLHSSISSALPHRQRHFLWYSVLPFRPFEVVNHDDDGRAQWHTRLEFGGGGNVRLSLHRPSHSSVQVFSYVALALLLLRGRTRWRKRRLFRELKCALTFRRRMGTI